MQTAYDLVWLSAERHPEHVALVDDLTDRSLTYGEMIAEMDAIAAGLAARGIGTGSRVATVLPNLFEHCLLLFALQRIGAVPAVVNPRLTPSEVGQLVEQGGIEAAIVTDRADLVAALRGVLPPGAPVFSVGGISAGAEDFAACRGEPADLPPRPSPGREDPAYIYYTSGTTGLPKGVVVPHRSIEHRVLWISPATGVRAGNHLRALGCSPLSHAIGFFCVYLIVMAYGGTYYTMSAFDPARANEMVEEHKISFLFAVPTIFHMMTSAPNYRPEAMASLRHVMFGGAPIPPRLLQRIADEWPAPPMHIFGTTETMIALHNTEPLGQETVLDPIFYARIRVIEPGGPCDAVVPVGAEGELIVDARSDKMFTGYLNRPDATAEKLRDGWYYTGDLCVRLDGGRVALRGRVDDVVRTGGENVHPEEVEAVLAEHPDVRECAVVGIADPRWGHMVVACVVANGTAPAARDLDAHCRASDLAGFKRPRAYVFVDALPRNAANKVLRRVLRETAATARDGAPGPRFEEPGPGSS
jgi:2-furoate---CoA ligase